MLLETKHNQILRLLGALPLLEKAQEGVAFEVHTLDFAVASYAGASATPAAGRGEAWVSVPYPPSDTEDMAAQNDARFGSFSLAQSFLLPLNEVRGFLGKRFVRLSHSFHNRDLSDRDFVVVEVAETLTWAEMGTPSSEHYRTPLWPSSRRERSAPNLTSVDGRRAIWTRYLGKAMRIAWKWPGVPCPRSSVLIPQ